MRVITWNLNNRATSAAWKILIDLNPDIVLLQEVSSIPQSIKDSFEIKFQKAIGKTGKLQQFGTAILVKGKIINELPLSSEYDWVNQELERYAGNLVSCTVQPIGHPAINIVSVYSPAWSIDTSKYPDVDITSVKLKENPKLWVTEILWSALKNANLADASWIIGGDFNSSETFDKDYQIEHKINCLVSGGNKEIRQRMEALGLSECLRAYNGNLVPTFKNPNGGKIIHQIDHLYVTNLLCKKLNKCVAGDQANNFGKSVSDHLPIIADFKDI